jgi:hypothetical protein
LGRLATAAAAVLGLAAMAGSAAGSPSTLLDGTYLYGESPVAGTIGAVYLVLTAQNGGLTGAVYQPSSSFDCVRATVGTRSLDLMVTDAYDQSEWPYDIALTLNATVASSSGGTAPLQLEGMYAIATLSDLDRQLLAVCSARSRH